MQVYHTGRGQCLLEMSEWTGWAPNTMTGSHETEMLRWTVGMKMTIKFPHCSEYLTVSREWGWRHSVCESPK